MFRPFNQIELKPIFVMGIMKERGNNPSGVPNKATYMFKDLARLNKYLKSKFFLNYSFS